MDLETLLFAGGLLGVAVFVMTHWLAERREADVHTGMRNVERFTCPLVGERQTNLDGARRQDIIRNHLQPGMQAHLEWEPENPGDHGALAVFAAYQQIGYLEKEIASRLAERVDSGHFRAEATIAAIQRKAIRRPHLGVTLEVTLRLHEK